jgi:hypothetical protein
MALVGSAALSLDGLFDVAVARAATQSLRLSNVPVWGPRSVGGR